MGLASADETVIKGELLVGGWMPGFAFKNGKGLSRFTRRGRVASTIVRELSEEPRTVPEFWKGAVAGEASEIMIASGYGSLTLVGAVIVFGAELDSALLFARRVGGDACSFILPCTV